MNNNIQPDQGQQYDGASPGQVPPSSRHMHPLMTMAAVAVIIANLTAMAAVTDVLSTSKATQGNTDPSVAAQSVAAIPGTSTSMALAVPNQMARPTRAASYSAQNVAPAPVRAREPSYAERAPSGNPSYVQTQPHQSVSPYTGHVTSVMPITMQGRETGLGMTGGAVMGGLLGNQIGRGNGHTLATVGSALAGGYGGHVAENYYHCDTEYRVNVRMDNDTTRSFIYKAAPGFQVGECVHTENGALMAG